MNNCTYCDIAEQCKRWQERSVWIEYHSCYCEQLRGNCSKFGGVGIKKQGIRKCSNFLHTALYGFGKKTNNCEEIQKKVTDTQKVLEDVK